MSPVDAKNASAASVVVQCGDLNSNPKRERGPKPHALPRLRFALTMGCPENHDFPKLYHYRRFRVLDNHGKMVQTLKHFRVSPKLRACSARMLATSRLGDEGCMANARLQGVMIGASYFGGIQAEAWRRIEEAEITAVTDPLPGRAAAFAAKWNIPRS